MTSHCMRLLPVLVAVACAATAADVEGQDPEAIAFVNVNVVPMDREVVLLGQTVLVDRGRIERIGDAGAVAVPEHVRRIDGQGVQFLMPGLCDSHMHILDPDELLLYLANGVTTVRNMSGEPFHLSWRREIAAERREGPTLLTASPTIDGVPPTGTNRVIATTRDEGARAVEAAVASGYDFIKVYSGLSPEAFGGIADAARRAGIKVVGHLPRSVGLAAAVAGGQASIDHESLLSGKWDAHLDNLLAQTKIKKKPETNGADVAADILLHTLDNPPKRARRPKKR